MKRRQIKRSKKQNGAPSWMVTYSDMVTLILVFFILLFAMSQIDKAKFEAVTDSFRNRMIFEFAPSIIPMDHSTDNSHQEQQTEDDLLKELKQQRKEMASRKKEKQGDTLDKLMIDVQSYLKKNKLTNVISATRTDRGVELILQERILFESGDADILNSGKPFLEKIRKMLEKIPNYVRVEGHTDNRPISNFRYPSNWELSGARASSVIRFMLLEKQLGNHRFSSVGYGDTRPLVSNTSPENWRKNRRVEIVILDQNQNQKQQR